MLMSCTGFCSAVVEGRTMPTNEAQTSPVANRDNLMPVADLEIRRLNTCSFDEAVRVWNEGFKGYFVDMTLSLDGYLTRLQTEGLSPEYSFVAFSEGQAVGFLLNGLRDSGGSRAAWNGGTGVSPEFRGMGVGKALMRATLDFYDEERVDIATLEAISDNERAISLYQSCGYQIVERLIFLQHEGRLQNQLFVGHDMESSYAVRTVAPAVAGSLSFYRTEVPWQAQWQSLALNNGAAVIISDAAGIEVGYALYKKKFDRQGKLNAVALYQCEVKPGRDDAGDIVASLLDYVYAPLEIKCRRSTYNFSMRNELVVGILRDAGFTIFTEQVHMSRRTTRY
jgi:ribosomal protein S18 acetylase RimI-like enzyme